MKAKIDHLKELVQEKGTEKMKELVIIAENYIGGLNNIFNNRDVHQLVLSEFDFPLFLKELQKKGTFENKSSLDSKILVMNVFFIARHVWEFKGKDGKLKTGNDLRREWPLMFEDDEMIGVEKLFENLKYF
jgi:hypothetical protein